MNLVDLWDKLTKKNKIIVGTVTFFSVCMVVLLVLGISTRSEVNALEEANQKLYEENKPKVETLQKTLDGMLDKDDSNYLTKDVSEEQVEKAYNQRGILLIEGEKISEEDYKKSMDKVNDTLLKVQTAFVTQKAVNTLYMNTKDARAMNGKELKKDLAIADDLKKETVSDIKKNQFIKEAKSDYEKTINSFITNAEAQFNQIEKAKVEVEKVFKEDKVISTDSKLYDTAKAEVDKIKNDKAKKDLQDKLDKVKADIDAKAKEQSEKEAQENAQLEAKAPVEAERATAQVPNNSTATDTTSPTPTTGNDTTGGNYTNGNNYDAGGQTPSYDGGGNTGGVQAPQAPSQPSTGGGGNGQGIMNQDEMDKAAENASNMDPTKDPNSPWYRP